MRDHIHPVCARGTKRMFNGQETVIACVECNSTLGGNMFPSIEERLRWLMDRYTDKYKLGNGAINWDEDEVDELGPGLRRFVRKAVAERQRAERRVQYGESVFYEMLMLDDGDAEINDNMWPQRNSA